jgi:hypothetical protein
MEIAHRHTSKFQQKRMAFFVLLAIMALAVTVTAYTGSLVAGWTGVFALVAALVLGASLACHKGCTPR